MVVAQRRRCRRGDGGGGRSFSIGGGRDIEGAELVGVVSCCASSSRRIMHPTARISSWQLTIIAVHC
ncbi:hypothetical protein RHMOL_Rhmol08G0194700 [Rhododendron molle]|uniref:Uncharacterized protein n=1 Tax=Rhododendron molle TaxID=49168 RepID=A0ACC0MS72_RHOML|nr:hypothetical protein RHMOL_Rhmol08G0194700 [Rhododendron molle]